MSTDIEIVAKLRADHRDMTRGFNAAGKSIHTLTGSFRDAHGRWSRLTGVFTSSSRRMRSGLQGVGDDAVAAGGKVSRAGGMMSNALGFVTGGAILGGIYALGNGLKELGTLGIKAASDQQQAMVAFEHMLGSAEAAQSYMSELYELAAKTPFEIADVVTGAKQLMGYGFEAQKATRYLTAMGDAASALSTGSAGIQGMTLAFGQMRAKGKIAQQELTQLAGYGVPALQYLADTFGVTTGEMQDMLSKGLIPAEEGIEAIIVGMEKGTKNAKGFGGMMAVQSETLAGLWSTFKDTLTIGLAEGLQPYIPAMSRLVKLATPMVGTVIGGAMKAISGVAGVIGKLVDSFSGMEGGGGLSTFMTSMKESADIILPSLKKFGGVLAETVLPAIMAVGEFIATSVIPSMAKLYPHVAKLAATIMDSLGPSLITAKDVIINDVVPALKEFWGFIDSFVIPYIGFLIDALGPVVKVIGFVLPPLLKQIGVNFKMTALAIKTVVNVLKFFVNMVKDRVSTAVKFFKEFPERARNAISSLPGVIGNVISQMKNRAVSLFNSMRSKVGSVMSSLYHTVVNWARNTITSGVAYFRSLPGRVYAYVRSIPGRIRAVFGSAGSWLVSAGRNLIRGLINGIKSLAGAAKNAAVNVAKSAVSSMKSFLHIGSPSRVFEEIGSQMGQGLVVGMKSEKPRVSGESRVLAASALPSQVATKTAAASSGRREPMVLRLESSGSRLDDLLMEMLRRAVRTRSDGDVVISFGRG